MSVWSSSLCTHSQAATYGVAELIEIAIDMVEIEEQELIQSTPSFLCFTWNANETLPINIQRLSFLPVLSSQLNRVPHLHHVIQWEKIIVIIIIHPQQQLVIYSQCNFLIFSNLIKTLQSRASQTPRHPFLCNSAFYTCQCCALIQCWRIITTTTKVEEFNTELYINCTVPSSPVFYSMPMPIQIH